jgi:hypothetical protein
VTVDLQLAALVYVPSFSLRREGSPLASAVVECRDSRRRAAWLVGAIGSA